MMADLPRSHPCENCMMISHHFPRSLASFILASSQTFCLQYLEADTLQTLLKASGYPLHQLAELSVEYFRKISTSSKGSEAFSHRKKSTNIAWISVSSWKGSFEIASNAGR